MTSQLGVLLLAEEERGTILSFTRAEYSFWLSTGTDGHSMDSSSCCGDDGRSKSSNDDDDSEASTPPSSADKSTLPLDISTLFGAWLEGSVPPLSGPLVLVVLFFLRLPFPMPLLACSC